MNWPTDPCDPIWDHADWLPVWYLLDRWCRQDARCRYAKQQALLSACERGEVDYRRSDGKTFDDPVHELASRGLLLVGRASFDTWVERIEGNSPLSSSSSTTKTFVPPSPPWADKTRLPSASAEPSGLPEDDEPPTRVEEPEMEGPGALPEGESDYASYPTEEVLRERGVPADEIISAFQVEPTRHDNAKWWKERMGNVSRANKKLAAALVQKGLPNRGAERYPSWWRPDLVAKWLIENRHLPSYKVAPILRKEFPVWAKLFDEQ